MPRTKPTEQTKTSTTKKTNSKKPEASKITKKKRVSKKSKKDVADEEKRQQEKHLVDLISQRDQATQARVDKLSTDQMKNLIQMMMKKNPAFVFHVMEENEKTSSSSSEDNLPTTSDSMPTSPPLPDKDPIAWCTCRNCRPMPTLLENVCCKGTPESCIAKFPEFTLLILEPMVLNMSNNYRNDFLGLSEENEEDLNKNFRHAAYRQFILWRHGYLGANNRKIIPSCCVLAIREKFPSPHGIYTGYKPDRLA